MQINRVSALNLIRKYLQTQFTMLSTIMNRIYAWFFKIELGDACIFYGFTTFQKSSNAYIRIGENNVFRSNPRSNLIGINRPCILTAHDRAILTIGSDCGFSGTVIGCFKHISLGDHVRCGANTLITDGDWHSDDKRSGIPKPVIIGNNVWLGVNVIVLKGVSIGHNSVIGAGSVVTKNIPENVIAAGNPCRVIRSIK